MDSLFGQYKRYLIEHGEYINNNGVIDWKNISKLLKLAKSFEANMISEMKNQKRSKNITNQGSGTVFDEPIEK